MIDDREIWACADQLIRKHGEEALAVANRRADDLMVEGKHEGSATFRRIADRIRTLNQATMSGSLH